MGFKILTSWAYRGCLQIYDESPDCCLGPSLQLQIPRLDSQSPVGIKCKNQHSQRPVGIKCKNQQVEDALFWRCIIFDVFGCLENSTFKFSKLRSTKHIPNLLANSPALQFQPCKGQLQVPTNAGMAVITPAVGTVPVPIRLLWDLAKVLNSLLHIKGLGNSNHVHPWYFMLLGKHRNHCRIVETQGAYSQLHIWVPQALCKPCWVQVKILWECLDLQLHIWVPQALCKPCWVPVKILWECLDLQLHIWVPQALCKPCWVSV